MKNIDEKKFHQLAKQFLSQELSVNDIDTLRQTIKFHEWKYAIQNNPIISDFEYDQLYKLLVTLEKDNPKLITPDSPTQRVTSDLNESFKTVEHIIPMLSLSNSYNIDDITEFDKQIKRHLNMPEDIVLEYVVEPKFDGGSVALLYENNLLIRAATRGNGSKGDNITNNMRALPSIPLSVDFSKYNINQAELRGEVLIRKDIFHEANTLKIAAGEAPFANPRNAATGGLRMKNPKEAASRGLEVFVYQIGHAISVDGKSALPQLINHSKSIELLSALGFKIPAAEMKICHGPQAIADFCAEWEIKRDSYPYEIDGMVIKLNSLELQERCGSTSHHPRWAIAYKFKAKQATSKLIDVEYQVGKIGAITPVAKIEPVQLAGVTVSSISLHNEEFIISKDIRMNDIVLVERAGDVIPYIVKSMEDIRDGSEVAIEFPSLCPSCQTKLIKQESEAAWRCPYISCPAQIIQKLIFHVSKNAMNIDGLGESLIDRFYALGWISDYADIYNLDYKKIAELEGLGQKSADNLQSAINLAKNNSIQRLLHSLSIHHFGKRASKIIAEEINHVLDLKDWTIEKFTDIKDIGPVVAKNVSQWFNEQENISMLERMENFGVNLYQTDEDKPLQISENAPLSGKTILFTGKLHLMSRKEAQEKAAKAGAKNISAVSSNLDILVVGEKAGSKLKKATALGTVEIWTEAEFAERMK